MNVTNQHTNTQKRNTIKILWIIHNLITNYIIFICNCLIRLSSVCKFLQSDLAPTAVPSGCQPAGTWIWQVCCCTFPHLGFSPAWARWLGRSACELVPQTDPAYGNHVKNTIALICFTVTCSLARPVEDSIEIAPQLWLRGSWSN